MNTEELAGASEDLSHSKGYSEKKSKILYTGNSTLLIDLK